MYTKSVFSTERKALLAFLMLLPLAVVVQHLVVGSRSKDSLAAKDDSKVQQIPETDRDARTPDSARVPADLPRLSDWHNHSVVADAITQQPTPAAGEAGLSALCDSLLHSSEGTIELKRVVRRWAEMDGAAAVAWAAQLMQSPTHEEVLTEVALGWARTNLPAAMDWANALPEGKSRQAIIEQLGYEVARTDAVKALETAISLESGRQRNDLLEHTISQWAIKDLSAAVQWAEADVSDEDLRQRLLAAVAVAVAGQDGAAAATLAATTLAPGDEQDRVVVSIVQRWVQNEPQQAAAWVAQFPDTPARESTVQNLVAFWAAQDREAAANWLQALPEGTLRDAGTAAYSQALAMTEIAATE